MIYNKETVSFSQWWSEISTTAIREYSLTLKYATDSNILYEYYMDGMDIHEAITTYKEENEK